MSSIENRGKRKHKQAHLRKSKFQADLAPAEDRMVRNLKDQLQISSNTDFLSDAVALYLWAVSERRAGRRILSESVSGEKHILVFPRLERVASNESLPHVDLQWTTEELEHLAKMVSGSPAEPTEALVRAMRH